MLRIHVAQFGTDYDMLKNVLRMMLVSTANYDARGVRQSGVGANRGRSGAPADPDAMDVGAVQYDNGKGKNKGNGKSKDNGTGKSKGKGKDKTFSCNYGGNAENRDAPPPVPFQGECGYCGIKGPKRADCRKRLAAQAASGKGGGRKGSAAALQEEAPVTYEGTYAGLAGESIAGHTVAGLTVSGTTGDTGVNSGLWVLAVQSEEPYSVNGVANDSGPVSALVDSGSDEHVAPWTVTCGETRLAWAGGAALRRAGPTATCWCTASHWSPVG